MKARRAYRFRLEPTPQQEEGLRRIAGACRAVYNGGLERRKEHYAQYEETLPYAAQNAELTELKHRQALSRLFSARNCRKSEGRASARGFLRSAMRLTDRPQRVDQRIRRAWLRHRDFA
jgi:transposase